MKTETQPSMLALLAMPLLELDKLQRSKVRSARLTFEHQWTAHLIRQALVENDELHVNELRQQVWALDNNVQDHLVISALYAHLVGRRLLRVDSEDRCVLAHTRRYLREQSFVDMPDTAAIKMNILFTLACNPDGIEKHDLLQKIYDISHDELATKVATWELIASGEIVAGVENTYTIATA